MVSSQNLNNRQLIMEPWDPPVQSEANPLRIVVGVLELGSAVFVLVGGGVVDDSCRT